MERERRTYPVSRNSSRAAGRIMLALAALIIISGLFSRNGGSGFSFERLPEQTAIPLNETFDETITETILEIPAQCWHALQVGVFENEKSANEAAMVFQKRGAAGYLWLDGRYRVLAAAYPDREDAQLVREQLREAHNIDSYLYTIDFPTLSIRLNGMQGQIEILQAAFEHAGDLAKQIQNLSVRMDRQELSVREAIEVLSAADTQMQLVALRLTQRFSPPVPETVQALIACFEDYGRFAQSLNDNESAAAMGMKLKYQHFVTLKHIQSVYQTLNHGQ